VKWVLLLGLCVANLSFADPRYAGGDYVGDIITLGVRDLSPRLSRFLETDPERQLFSAYSYAAGTPVTVADPTGAVLGTELIAIRMIEDTRGLYLQNTMTAEETKTVSHANIAAINRSGSLAEFFPATDAALLFENRGVPEASWHIASCNCYSERPRRFSLKPYQEEWGASDAKRQSRNRTMFGFQGDTDVGWQLLDDDVLVRRRNHVLSEYNRRMAFLADPGIIKIRGIPSPIAGFQDETKDLYALLRESADRMAECVAQYDAVITRGREQAGAYFRGLDRVLTRYDNMGFIYLAQQDPQVLRALHETHRSMMPRAAPKSRWSWLPWKRRR
ncbi:hypothetical protein, partial [Thiolapillus sp.]|uniref:hypothetical protein n=1 Tax=Thiolapillus sp. TaxID=2017437 RepID=UPI003AF5E6F3